MLLGPLVSTAYTLCRVLHRPIFINFHRGQPVCMPQARGFGFEGSTTVVGASAMMHSMVRRLFV